MTAACRSRVAADHPPLADARRERCRIGFLFNHRPDEVWHAAPIAFELARLAPGAEIVILVVDHANLAAVKEIAARYPGQDCIIELARIPQPVRRFAAGLSVVGPLLKEVVLHRDALRFAGFDALVAPDLGSLRLKQRLPQLPMIRVRHGAGDRASGFDQRNALFDLVLLPGAKYERRHRSRGLLREHGYAIIGYPKFDAVQRAAGKPPRLFDNDLPVVLYTPHFDTALTSWHAWGLRVLDYFVANPDRYNLIFAPHLKLFEQWLRRRAWLPGRYRHRPNIHVDLGSPASADMTYTRAADIYLGDVSSQVYEFLQRPRPCLFLNAHGVAWQDDPNFSHWQLGRVLHSPDELGPALDHAPAEHARYLDAQKRAFADTFELSDTPSAARGARAILDFIRR